jgi:dTDP-4-amino-4,6-dideoxygalactose transaminase
MSQLPFLPFSKPVIDEATIAAVGDVLRSGWITSGPKVQAFEAQLSEYFGGARCARSTPAPAPWKSPCASPASARVTK